MKYLANKVSEEERTMLIKKMRMNPMLLCFFTLACPYHTPIVTGHRNMWWCIDPAVDILYLNRDEKIKDDKDSVLEEMNHMRNGNTLLCGRRRG